MRYRRVGALQLYWQDDELRFHNYLQRLTVSAIPFTVELLDALSDWQGLEALARRFSQYSRDSLEQSLLALVENQLVVCEGSVAAQRDEQACRDWAPWLPSAGFHFSSKDCPYVTADSPDELKRATLPSTPQPPHYKPAHGDGAIALPPATPAAGEFIEVLLRRRTHRSFGPAPLTLVEVATLLQLVWGVQDQVDTPTFGKLPLKTSPSGGARHPGEVYLMALRVEGLAPGIYHYHPLHHTLALVNEQATPALAAAYCADQRYVGDAAALFLMTAVFPRAMWKYHKPRAYRVVTLDAGHLGQTFCLVATWLGLAPFGTAALKDTLIEEDLGIDGVNESVLFVTGAGRPLPPEA
ncbi:SagB family peptide dehydrogenase [Chitinimonas sp.]|uniref:SagB family peptide dehydrogenase n=1 Tax=Chitinimonas sp. TaxID=1934313 RepID=UPI0035B3F682